MAKTIVKHTRVTLRRATATRAPTATPAVPEALAACGIRHPRQLFWNLSVPALYEEALRRGEGHLAQGGPLVVRTGVHTGRAPNDKYIVEEPSSRAQIDWGEINRPMTPTRFDQLYRNALASLRGKDVFVQECVVCADPAFHQPVRVITETAWHSLFARTMFGSCRDSTRQSSTPAVTLIHTPSVGADPQRDGTRSPTYIVIHFGKRLILIGGTAYAGEIKKSVFTVMNYLLPQQGVLSMHCAANVGASGDVALFFGLSGTGKTSLSADSRRTLIGDDEHGWSDHGIFNVEAGCYAKMIRLSQTAEPEIYATTKRFGTILENIPLDSSTGALDLESEAITENTRGAYPLSFIPHASTTGTTGHPAHLLMLTCDAFGVMPPIARLSPEQAIYHFLSGYTAKVAGTEAGVTEPRATFSACFGAPFMALPPRRYADLLREKIQRHRVTCWLVNTGWTGGPYGVGSRIKISYTRAMVEAALRGELNEVPVATHPVFGVEMITQCPAVPSELLDPRRTWRDPAAYDAKARELQARFEQNFARFGSPAQRR